MTDFRRLTQLGTLRRAKRKVDELTGVIGQSADEARSSSLSSNRADSCPSHRQQPSRGVTPLKRASSDTVVLLQEGIARSKRGGGSVFLSLGAKQVTSLHLWLVPRGCSWNATLRQI